MSGTVSLPGEQVSLVPGGGNVNITGGSINGTSIGATTPSSGAFTTVSASAALTSTANLFLHERVVTAAGAINTLTTDTFVIVNQSPAAAVTVTIQANPAVGRIMVIKDGAGQAASNPITVSAGGTTLIDGQTTQTIATNYGVMRLVYNGSSWNIW